MVGRRQRVLWREWWAQSSERCHNHATTSTMIVIGSIIAGFSGARARPALSFRRPRSVYTIEITLKNGFVLHKYYSKLMLICLNYFKLSDRAVPPRPGSARSSFDRLVGALARLRGQARAAWAAHADSQPCL